MNCGDRQRERIPRWKLICVLIAGLMLASNAQAQDDIPRLMLTTGGPTGSIRVLEFSADSKTLFGGGLNKSLSCWTADRDAGFEKPHLSTTLRWEVARENRGVIYSVAASPIDQLVAMGGYSTRQASGDIVVYDPTKSEFVAVLPRERPAQGTGPGHGQPVDSLNFSPDGQKLVSVSNDGEMRVWDRATWTSKVIREAYKPRLRVPTRLPAVFVTNSKIVAAFKDEARGKLGLHLYDLEAVSNPRDLNALHSNDVYALARRPDRLQWASCDDSGMIFLGDGEQVTHRLKPAAGDDSRSRVTSLKLSANGVMAATRETIVRNSGGQHQSQFSLEVWSVDGQPRTLDRTSLGLPGDGDTFACAVSPDNQWVAVSSPDDMQAVELYRLRDKQNRPLAQALRQGSAAKLHGNGRKLRHVAFAADNTYRVTFGSSAAPEHQTVFDPIVPDIIQNPGQLKFQPLHGGDDWKLTAELPQPGQPQRLVIQSPQGNRRWTITLDLTSQGVLNEGCYCWLRNSNGEIGAVAVGTDQSKGIYVYEIAAPGECRLIRYFRDHTDQVTSLSVSRDGKYLASAAWDQTVKIWSLAGLFDKENAFSRYREWGADFRIVDGRVVIHSALGAGIAVHRGMQAGDVITSLRHAPNVVLEAPDAILNALATRPLWESIQVGIKRENTQDQLILVTPAWEPLLTLFATNNGADWALWTPQGVYNSSVNGDQFFGWQVNRGRNVAPEFFEAKKFRAELEKPDVIRRILTAGSLQQAVAALNAQPAPSVRALAAQRPRIKILSPTARAHFATGEQVEIRAEITFPPETPIDRYDVEAVVNQVTLGPPTLVSSANGTQVYRWRDEPAERQSRVSVRVIDRQARALATSLQNETTVEFTADVAPYTPKLHFLGIGLENYPGNRKLNLACDDVFGMQHAIQAGAGVYYECGVMQMLVDNEDGTRVKQVTNTQIETQLQSFMDEVGTLRREDIVVLFISGHAVEGNDQNVDAYYYIPSAARDWSDLKSNAVSWTSLRALAKLPCRKIFLLDTCNSGEAVNTEKVLFQQDALKKMIRPLNHDGPIVFAAVTGNKAANELNVEKYSYFTDEILNGLAGKADGVIEDKVVPEKKDHDVDLAELFNFVRQSVRTRIGQVPSWSPPSLLSYADFKLVRINDASSKAVADTP